MHYWYYLPISWMGRSTQWEHTPWTRLISLGAKLSCLLQSQVIFISLIFIVVSCTQSAYLYVTNDLGNNNITANASSLKLNLTASTFARVSRETLYADGAALTYLLNNQAWRASLDFNNMITMKPLFTLDSGSISNLVDMYVHDNYTLVTFVNSTFQTFVRPLIQGTSLAVVTKSGTFRFPFPPDNLIYKVDAV